MSSARCFWFCLVCAAAVSLSQAPSAFASSPASQLEDKHGGTRLTTPGDTAGSTPGTASDDLASSAATTVVERYFAYMRKGDLAVVELFHDDAILLGLGRRTMGREAIGAFYSESIATGGPQPRLAGPLLTDGQRVAAEIYIDLSGGSTLHVVDLFRVEDGKIRSLHYFVADEPAAEPDGG